jgi:hypothetical protein
MPNDYVILSVVAVVLLGGCAFLYFAAKVIHERRFGRSKPSGGRE